MEGHNLEILREWGISKATIYEGKGTGILGQVGWGISGMVGGGEGAKKTCGDMDIFRNNAIQYILLVYMYVN